MVRAVLAALALALTIALGASAARAGTWIQVACVNPDGSAAPSEGWSAQGDATSPGASASTACGPGSPMEASLPSSPVPSTSFENFDSKLLVFTPPPGSALLGGTFSLGLSADGSGAGSLTAGLEMQGTGNHTQDFEGVSCQQSSGCNVDTTQEHATTSTPDWSGTVTLGPIDPPGTLSVYAGCFPGPTLSCDGGGPARATVASADVLLATDATPGIAGRASGSALVPRVHGTARLAFTATDPGGPGVYAVTATLDDRMLYRGTPDLNGGTCAAVGTGAGGALMFDHRQPCPQTAALDVPVPTAALPDGFHRLVVAVTDAAGTTTTVLDRRIRTVNPRTTRRPRHGLRARLRLSWDWSARGTILRSIAALDLPRAAALSVACAGPRCPRLPVRSARGRQVRRLLHGLAGRRFHPGDRIRITVTARHRRPERIVLLIRRNRIPRARLLG